MRFWILDALRWFLASYVFLYHSAEIYGWGEQNAGALIDTALRYGYLSVYIFFIISGIAIYVSTSESPHAFKFLQHRTIRLVPGLVLTALIGGLTAAYLRLNNSWGESYSDISIQVLANLLPNPDSEGKFRDAVVWSLAVEIQFYVYVSLFLMLLEAKGNRVKNLESSWKMFVYVWLTLVYIADFLRVDTLDQILMKKYAPFFIFGLVLALLRDKKIKSSESATLFLLLTPPLISEVQALSHAAYLLDFRIDSDRLFGVSAQNFGILVFTGLLLVLIASTLVKQKNHKQNFFQKTTASLGKASYTFYLLGGFFGLALVRIFGSVFPEGPSIGISYMVVAVISLLFSIKIEPKIAKFYLTTLRKNDTE